MSEEKKYEKAFDFLFKQAIPNEVEIDRMSQEEVEEYLADSGVDIQEYRKRVAAKKLRFAGKYALMRARQERLQQKEREQPLIEVPETKEGIIEKLMELWESRNLGHLYGRNFGKADYEELRQLYIDTVKEDPGNYGTNAEGERDQGGTSGD